MTRMTIAPALAGLLAFATPLRAQQVQNDPAQHNHDATTASAPAADAAGMHDMRMPMMRMMNGMAATDAKLDDLVKKMNQSTGTAKVDAMAALLTAIVEEHRANAPAMHHMMMMMNMMGMMSNMTPSAAGDHDHDAPAPPK